MDRRHFSIGLLLAGAGCSAKTEAEPQSKAQSGARATLAGEKAKYKTVVHFPSSYGKPIDTPPKKIFDLVSYPSAVGDLGAYLTPDPGDGRKHPAIVWITGGESNSIDDMWTPRSRENDQSAAAYRKAGIIMMFPSLRGGNHNPGKVEGLYGEVDDVLAAADYLAKLPWVDPARIYLGGHSTGGTLAVLTAETRGSRFRAVLASGPVDDGTLYGKWFIPYDFTTLPEAEHRLRSPVEWLPDVEGRLFIVEGYGDEGASNIEPLRVMKAANANTNITFAEVPNCNHFSVLAPLNEVMARKILADTGQGPVFDLTAEEITRQMSAG